MKVAIIGAGSLVFCKTLMLDTMQIPGIGHVEFTLMAPSTRNTSCVKRFADQIIAKYKIDAEVKITTSREEALEGADYVIATLKIGGLRAYDTMLNPLKYGFNALAALRLADLPFAAYDSCDACVGGGYAWLCRMHFAERQSDTVC